MHKDIADKFGFQYRTEAYVKLLNAEEIPQLSQVTISFRDQYIGRLPMRQIRNAIKGHGAYIDQRVDVESACVRAKIDGLCDRFGNVSFLSLGSSLFLTSRKL